MSIEGFTLTLHGRELIAMCQEKVVSLQKRLAQLEVSLPQDEDMADEVAKKIKDAKKDLDYFSFSAEHIEARETYRMKKDDLRLFGIGPAYR